MDITDDNLDNDPTLIVHIATQFNPGREAKMSYVISGLNTVLEDVAGMDEAVLAIPEIGCGIGGLDIEDVAPVIEALANAHKVHVELWHYVPVDTAATAVVGSV